jgi:small subunit ribosomal protein S8
MSQTDTISDMLVRIRNAQMAQRDVVDVPHSRMKEAIGNILRREGFIKDLSVEGGTKKTLRLFLRYTDEREPMIRGIKRVSRPGRRHYTGATEIPRVLGGMGVAIVSTSSGVMSDAEARKRRLGGEMVCTVW